MMWVDDFTLPVYFWEKKGKTTKKFGLISIQFWKNNIWLVWMIWRITSGRMFFFFLSHDLCRFCVFEWIFFWFKNLIVFFVGKSVLDGIGKSFKKNHNNAGCGRLEIQMKTQRKDDIQKVFVNTFVIELCLKRPIVYDS